MSSESWLASDDPDKFAAAAMACEGFTPSCVAAEACQHEGECFRTMKKCDRLAAKLICRLLDGQPADIADALNDAAAWLRERPSHD